MVPSSTPPGSSSIRGQQNVSLFRNYLAAVAPVWLIYGSISSGTSPKRPRDKVSKRDESKDRNFDLRKKLFLGPLRFGSPTGLKKIIEVTSSFI